MHGSLKNFRYGGGTRGSHMGKKEEPFGVRISWHNGNSETRWFATKPERERHYNLLHEVPQIGIKSIKRKER